MHRPGRLRLDLSSPREEYRVIGKKGEGTFSEVLKCQHIKDGTYYACKKMKQRYDAVDKVNNLREIQAMRRLNPHVNIIGLHEIIYNKKTGTVALICELMDMNVYELIRDRRHFIPEPKVKSYIYQLLNALEHMHRCGIFHRDVKPENILLQDDTLKLADFGSCRSVYSKHPYTEYISTRWYRAPECLLTDGYYTHRMDMWSVGCVFYEIMSLRPLFPGANEVDQLTKIHETLGTPEPSVLNKIKHRNRAINFDFPPKKGKGIEESLGHASKHCIELIYKMCTYDPDERITAKEALRHSYFKQMRNADKKGQQESQRFTRYEVASLTNLTGPYGGDAPAWKHSQVHKKKGSKKTSIEDLTESGKSWKVRGKRSSIRIGDDLKERGELKSPERNAVQPRRVTVFPEVGVLTPSERKRSEINRNISQRNVQNKKKGIKKPKKKSWEQALETPQQPLSEEKTRKVQRIRNSCAPPSPLSKKIMSVLNQRRQRRMVEQQQQQNLQTLGIHGSGGLVNSSTLPHLVPVNRNTTHNPRLGVGTKLTPTTLPKVHFSNHRQGNPSTVLPSILKTNILQPKVLLKAKYNKPADSPTKHVYGHYHLPSINRNMYH